MPELSWPMLDGDFADSESGSSSKDRNEAMPFSIKVYRLGSGPSISFVAAVMIVQMDARFSTDHPIEDAARKHFVPGIVPDLLPSTDYIVAFREFLEKLGYLNRIVLQVRVKSKDDIACRPGKTGRQCGCLAKISLELNSEN
jgi:hypothetical protein